MQLNISIANDKLTKDEVAETLQETLERELQFAQYKLEKYRKWCNNFEKKYGIVSNEFIDRFEDGKLGDEDDFFDWFAATKGVKNWERKYQVLLEAKVE